MEEEAMKTFLVFESGESGDLSFNEFQQAVHEIGMDMEDRKVLFIIHIGYKALLFM